MCILPWTILVKIHLIYKNTWTHTEKDPGIWSTKPKRKKEKRHCIRYNVENQPTWNREFKSIWSLPTSACAPEHSASPTDLTYLLPLAVIKTFNPSGKGLGWWWMPSSMFSDCRHTRLWGFPSAIPRSSQDQCRALHVPSGFTLESLKKMSDWIA